MAQLAPQPSITLRFLAAPTDVIIAGSAGVHGGRVLEWIDKAAYACAAGWSGTYCVTAYVGHIHFTRPIPSGHMVEVRSRIVYTGRSTMHIVNEVLSADPGTATSPAPATAWSSSLPWVKTANLPCYSLRARDRRGEAGAAGGALSRGTP